MSLPFLKRQEKDVLCEGILEYLLTPDLPSKQFHSSWYELVVMRALCRLSRDHPYTVVCVDVQSFTERSPLEDVGYFDSLPSLSLNGKNILKYVERGDISPFVPKSEDEFLLLLPTTPPSDLPPWPWMILDLEGIFVTQVDEFLKIETAASNIVNLLDSLPLDSLNHIL